MSEHSQEPVAPVVARRIEAIVSSAERAANEFRRQVEAASTEHADTVKEAADADARRIRHEAATRAAQYLADSRRIVDEFAAERIARISALTDKLIEQTELVQRRFAHAENVRRQVYDLIASLGAAAETIAKEAQAADPQMPLTPDEEHSYHERQPLPDVPLPADEPLEAAQSPADEGGVGQSGGAESTASGEGSS